MIKSIYTVIKTVAFFTTQCHYTQLQLLINVLVIQTKLYFTLGNLCRFCTPVYVIWFCYFK